MYQSTKCQHRDIGTSNNVQVAKPLTYDGSLVCGRVHFDFFFVISNLIFIYSPFVNMVSKICFVHEQYFLVSFQEMNVLYALFNL